MGAFVGLPIMACGTSHLPNFLRDKCHGACQEHHFSPLATNKPGMNFSRNNHQQTSARLCQLQYLPGFFMRRKGNHSQVHGLNTHLPPKTVLYVRVVDDLRNHSRREREGIGWSWMDDLICTFQMKKMMSLFLKKTPGGGGGPT